MAEKPARGYTRTTIAVVLGTIIVVSVIGVVYITRSSTITTSTSCSGYPPGGNCPGPYSYNFTISVSYTGSWKVAYQGYNSGGPNGNPLVNGNYSGTGIDSRGITLTGQNDQFLTLCATAQKLDGSNATLMLTVTGSNSTSAPYGSVTYCGGVVP